MTAMPREYFDGEPLEIGPGPHLFLDDHLIEDQWALRRAVNSPYRYTGNPVLIANRGWEERPYRPHIVHDESTGKYRMYYQCFSGANYWMQQGPSYYTCYAESDDCLNWSKPESTDMPFGDYRATNVMHVDGDRRIQAPWIFPDRTGSDPERPWCMIYNCAGLRLARSADGIRWTADRPDPLFKYHSDTQNHVVWNPDREEWMLYMRPPLYATGVQEGPGKRHTRRRTAVRTGRDLYDLTPSRTVLFPDEFDAPDFDATHVFRYRDLYIGMVTLLHHEENGANDVMLASSRDGLNWDKLHSRDIWMPRGRKGDFDGGCIGFGGDPVRKGMDLWFFYSGFPEPQSVFDQEGAIGLSKLGQDRFVCMEAPKDEHGYLLTREFVWHGKRLALNCRMRSGDRNNFGDLRVEIVQQPDEHVEGGGQGVVVPGHSLDDCDLVRSNSPRQIVSWNGDSDLSSLEGKPVHLRFRMRNGGLFAFEMDQER